MVLICCYFLRFVVPETLRFKLFVFWVFFMETRLSLNWGMSNHLVSLMNRLKQIESAIFQLSEESLLRLSPIPFLHVPSWRKGIDPLEANSFFLSGLFRKDLVHVYNEQNRGYNMCITYKDVGNIYQVLNVTFIRLIYLCSIILSAE